MFYDVIKLAAALCCRCSVPALHQPPTFIQYRRNYGTGRAAGALFWNRKTCARPSAAYARQPDSLMVIHHGNAQQTQLQATELRSWLTSLAVDSARILLLADLPANDGLSIEIRMTK